MGSLLTPSGIPPRPTAGLVFTHYRGAKLHYTGAARALHGPGLVARGVPELHEAMARGLPRHVVQRTTRAESWHGACVTEREGRRWAREGVATDTLGMVFEAVPGLRLTHHSGATLSG